MSEMKRIKECKVCKKLLRKQNETMLCSFHSMQEGHRKRRIQTQLNRQEVKQND